MTRLFLNEEVRAYQFVRLNAIPRLDCVFGKPVVAAHADDSPFVVLSCSISCASQIHLDSPQM
jgi:hypothetical protein